MERRNGACKEKHLQLSRRWRVLGFFFLLAFVPVTAAESQELQSFSTSSFTLTRSEQEDTITEFKSFRQNLDVNWKRSISPFLSYRISLRGERTEDRTTAESESIETSSLMLQPAFDLTLATPRYSLNTGLRLREQITDGNQVERVRFSDRNMFARLFLTPIGLPPLSFLVDRTISVDDRSPRSRDSEDTRYQVSTQYAFQNLNVFYTFSHQTGENKVSRSTRNQQNHQGSLGYSQSFFHERLSLQGNYAANYTRSSEEFLVPSIVEVERELQRGLRADPDPTPKDSSDVPVMEAPALLTGTANIPLELSVAIGYESVTRESVTVVEITLIPEPPFRFPDNLETFLSFRVFHSNDTTLTTWSEVSGVSQSFDPFENRFTLRFSTITARFFKVFVSRNDFGASVRATGITALDLEQVAAGTERITSTLIHTLSAGLTLKPIKVATVFYNFSLTATKDEPDSIQTTNGAHTASLIAEPHWLLTTTLTYQRSFADSNQPDTEDTTADTYSLTLSSSPLPTLTNSLGLVRSENRSAGELQSRNETASLNAAAEIYRNLQMNSTYSLSRARDFTTGQESFGQGLALSMNAALTSKLRAILEYTFQKTRTEGAGPETTATAHSGSGSFTYTPSRLLNLNARFNFSDTGAGTTFSQNYRLDWRPTFKTSLFINYRRLAQRSSGATSTSDALALNGRWNISRHLDLNASYTFTRGSTGNTVQSFFGSLGLRL